MKTLKFTIELLKFTLVSVPIACVLYTIAYSYFKLKRLIK